MSSNKNKTYSTVIFVRLTIHFRAFQHGPSIRVKVSAFPSLHAKQEIAIIPSASVALGKTDLKDYAIVVRIRLLDSYIRRYERLAADRAIWNKNTTS